MKKLILGLVILFAVVGGGFIWLLAQSGPHNAPKGENIVDVTDKIAD